MDFADLDAIAGDRRTDRRRTRRVGAQTPGSPTRRVAESSVDEWRATMTVNVVGAVALTLAPCRRCGRRRPRGVHQLRRGPHLVAGVTGLLYSASKFVLRGFADSLRADEPALRVTTVYPGRIDTDMQRDLVAYEGGGSTGPNGSGRRRWRSSSPMP